MGLFVAIDGAGERRFVGEVARGALCACFCPVCKSPLVSKQGSVNIWHFAHEGGQERPECWPGSINLLRSLAIDTLKLVFPKVMPPASEMVLEVVNGRTMQRHVQWDINQVDYLSWLDAPSSTEPAAQFLIGDLAFNLYVEIGNSGTLPYEQSQVDGWLVYACPAPIEGQISTQLQATEFLARHASFRWGHCPDFLGRVSAAREEMREIGRQEKLAWAQRENDIRDRIVAKQLAYGYTDTENAPRALGGTAAPHPAKNALPANLPPWAHWKKPNTSFFAFQLDQDTHWIVMQSALHTGCFVVPAPTAFEGWDECLPSRLGVADTARNALISDSEISDITQWFYAQRVKSKVDSDPVSIAKFVGWV